MNVHDPKLADPKVTRDALPGSCKVYSQPDGAPDLRVPFREIALAEGAPASSSEAVGQTKTFRV